MKSNNVAKGKKIASIIGICLASALVIVAFCGRYFQSGFKQFANFFLGSFGMAFYGLMAAVIVACSFTLAGKSIKIPAKYIVHFVLMFVSFTLLIHLLTTTYLPTEFYNDKQTGYIQLVYHYYDNQLGIPTFGGAVFGSLAYALKRILTIYGATILVLLLLLWTAYVVGEFFYSYATGKLRLRSKPENASDTPIDMQPSQATVDTQIDQPSDARALAYQRLFENNEPSGPVQVSVAPPDVMYGYSPQSVLDDGTPITRESAEDILFNYKKNDDGNSTLDRTSNFFTKTEPDAAEDEFLVHGYFSQTPPYGRTENPSVTVRSDPIVRPAPEPAVERTTSRASRPFEEPAVTSDIDDDRPIIVNVPDSTKEQDYDDDDSVDITDVVVDDPRSADATQPAPSSPFADTYSMQLEPSYYESESEQQDIDEPVEAGNESYVEETTARGPAAIEPVQNVSDSSAKSPAESKTQKPKEAHKYLAYNRPTLELLNNVSDFEDTEAEARRRAADAIITKLALYNISVELADILVGPSITRYMFSVTSPKTRMNEFKQYTPDIKACIEARDNIIIQAPVHGTNLVGIEVPNGVKRPVLLRSVLESKEFAEAKGELVFAIGEDITGKPVVADLADMPHLLIAGSTGSGKSVCLNCLVVSLIYRYGPEYVRMLMVDPKYVEFSKYNGLPHLLTREAIIRTENALSGMDYLIKEMDARYELLHSAGVENIKHYNKQVGKNAPKMPYIVFIVDELADLMSESKKAFEAKLGKLAQKSRAAGIHIVLATQRPDVTVITGLIKANLPCRMALKVASQHDSQTILNGGGAERLLGKGDMYFMGPGSSELVRIQGAYVSNDEIRSFVDYTKNSNEVYYDDAVYKEIFEAPKKDEETDTEAAKEASKDTPLDLYCKKALRYWLEKNNGKASIASIQRSLGIGFNRAGRIVDALQKLKYVEEPSDSESNTKQLRVLVTLDQLDELFPNMED